MAERTELENKIIEVLQEHGPMGSKPLFDKVRIATDRRELSLALHNLDGLVKKQSNSQWAVIKSALKQTPEISMPATHTPFRGYVENPRGEAAPTDVSKALDELTHALTDHRPVQDLDLKCEVLGRLASLLDPSISQVLTAIQGDLRGAAQ